MIHEGDIVRVASGGPQMTVAMKREPDPYAYCEWFNERGTHFQGIFPTSALEVVESDYLCEYCGRRKGDA